MLARMWNNKNSHSLLGEMQHGAGALEDSLAIAYKTKPLLPEDSAIVLFDISPKVLEFMTTQNPAYRC